MRLAYQQRRQPFLTLCAVAAEVRLLGDGARLA